jgi:8-oxo-dGTP pyrophosphatase MutT (NUDIX family)
MNLVETIEILTSFRTEDLKGEKAHIQAYPPFRLALYKDKKPTEKTRKSAVLILFYEANSKVHICLIKRPQYNGHHSSQVAFPGGKYEKFDSNLIQTALREAQEEIGIEPSSINVANELTTVYIPVSEFTVKPVLAYTLQPPVFQPSNNEVEYIIEAQIEELLASTLVNAEVNTPKGNIVTPAFLIQNEKIWGATAMILNELRMLLLERNT